MRTELEQDTNAPEDLATNKIFEELTFVEMEMKSILEEYNYNLQTEKDLVSYMYVEQFANKTIGGGRNLEEMVSDTIKTLPEPNPKNKTEAPKIILGGVQGPVRGIKYNTTPPTSSSKSALKNYLVRCEKTAKRIFDLMNELTSSIKHEQEDVKVFHFEVASALLLLTIIILGFRVVAFIFDKQVNYKKLPTNVKEEIRQYEEASKKSERQLFIASNPLMMVFAA